ncbi:MAG: hypothetical protein H2069_09500 [Legionella sp.]|nr:hypothetical protein [Legionella sp.]
MKDKQKIDLKNATITDPAARHGLQNAVSVAAFLNSLPGRAAMTLVRTTHDWMKSLTLKQHQSYFRALHLRYLRLRLAALSRRKKHLKEKDRAYRAAAAAAEEAVLAARRSSTPIPTETQKSWSLPPETVQWIQQEILRLDREKQILSAQYDGLLADFDVLENGALEETLSAYTAATYQDLVTEIKTLAEIFSSQIVELNQSLARIRAEGPTNTLTSPADSKLGILPLPLALQTNKFNELVAASKKQQSATVSVSSEAPTPSPSLPKPTPKAAINKERVIDFLAQLSALKGLVLQHQCQTMCCYEESAQRLQSMLQPAPKVRPEEPAPTTTLRL